MKELTTEEKIIEVAKKIFTQRGYEAAKIRDIAQEAGINQALLNYHFGSKENLFKIVVENKFYELLHVLVPIMSDGEISLEQKVEMIVNNYIDLLLENKDLAIFVLNELKNNKRLFEERLREVKSKSFPIIDKQIKERGLSISSTDFVINTISLTIFPIIAEPLFVSAGLHAQDSYGAYIEELRKKIPGWIFKISE